MINENGQWWFDPIISAPVPKAGGAFSAKVLPRSSQRKWLIGVEPLSHFYFFLPNMVNAGKIPSIETDQPTVTQILGRVSR